jgi:hypothetical protein
MFVRIKSDARKTNVLTECRQFKIYEEGPGYTLCILKDKSFERRILIDKTKDEVYISNDQGETIDSYEWDMVNTGTLDVDGNRVLSHVPVKVNYPKDTTRKGIVEKGEDGNWVVSFDDVDRSGSVTLSALPRYRIEVIGSGEPA